VIQEDLLERAAITHVLTTYARAVDRRDLAAARSTYHDDAYDDHGRYRGDVDGLFAFFEQLGDSLVSTFHMLGTPHIELRGDVAWCETYCLYRRESRPDRPDGVVLQGLRYLDRLEKQAGTWRIAHRQVVLDWEQQGGPAPVVPSGDSWLRGSKHGVDPSAAFFASAPAATPPATQTPDAASPH
jgi:ketosteroid isomerase-like protein